MSPSIIVNEDLTSLDWDGDTKVCLIYILPKCFVGYPAILALDSAVRSALELPHAKVCVP